MMDANIQKTQKSSVPAHPKTVLSDDPEKALQEMMDRIDALRLVYVEENEALAHADTSSYMLLQKRKIQATQDYQDHATEFLARKDEMGNIGAALREEFKVLQTDFSVLTEENLTLLKRVQNGITRLHERVINAAKETATKDGVNYGAAGQLKRHSHNISLGLNESA